MCPRINGPLEGRELTRAGNGGRNNGPLMGIKRYSVHYGPVSSRAFNGPTVTKGLIWAERHHGPYMGRKLQWAGIILDGPDNTIGPDTSPMYL